MAREMSILYVPFLLQREVFTDRSPVSKDGRVSAKAEEAFQYNENDLILHDLVLSFFSDISLTTHTPFWNIPSSFQPSLVAQMVNLPVMQETPV